MLNYTICEISGKQYKVIPGQVLEIALQEGTDPEIEANVLLLSEDGKLKIGKPYLKEKLALKRVEDSKLKKIRISKFHAKANYRRTTGFRAKITKVVLPVKKA
ncbi:50S ribosomal protein L21 [Candidatus Daviesbacteria bacterium]|nr:50S ribosomal protein L21 [Candidatus Daviesbacteria bacterium]